MVDMPQLQRMLEIQVKLFNKIVAIFNTELKLNFNRVHVFISLPIALFLQWLQSFDQGIDQFMFIV